MLTIYLNQHLYWNVLGQYYTPKEFLHQPFLQQDVYTVPQISPPFRLQQVETGPNRKPSWFSRRETALVAVASKAKAANSFIFLFI